MPRQPIVYTWWARRWVELLDELSWEFESRLAKARAIARNGSVLQLIVVPGGIRAQVYGSWGDRYSVRVELTPLGGPVWARVVDALAREASYLARLLAQELPPELETICAQAGGQFFPARLNELRASCTCPDAANPCKHILAVLYAFAIRVDQEPGLLLHLRGRQVSDLTAQLRARWASDTQAGASEQEPPETGAETAALRPDRFFEAGPELDAFAASFHLAEAPPPIDAALLVRLGRPPFAGPNEDPHEILAPVYAIVSDRALQAAKRSAKKAPRRRQRTNANNGTKRTTAGQ